MKCKLYYEVDDREITLIVQSTRFPYRKLRISAFCPYYNKHSYNDRMDELIEGGEEYMLHLLEEEIETLNRKDKAIKKTKTKEEKLCSLKAETDIPIRIWRELKKKF